MSEKLESEVFKEVMTDELKYLFDLFRKNSFELRIAGGAVRDLLMGKKPEDIDFATTATPDQMKELFNRENVRMLNTNGEKHGTITIRLNDKENYEITTLRIDVITDGRHAEVQFTNDWKLDANRRDLTVNSIFLDADGTIVDFFNGYHDLKMHRIKFVGEPNRRIQEDYLRILRYFRFYGRICVDENSHDEESIEAIRKNSSGLENIAGERIWVEFKKIVCGRFADSLMRHIVDTNVHKHIGLPDNLDLDEFKRVYKLFENNLKEIPMPITMICAFYKAPNQFEKLHKRMKFSNEEKKLAEFIFAYRKLGLVDYTQMDNVEKCLKPFKDILVDNVKDAKIVDKLKELLKYINKMEYIPYLEYWPIPAFPITGDMLASKHVPKGPIYTKILTNLKEIWKNEYNFDTSDETIQKLLVKCDQILANKS